MDGRMETLKLRNRAVSGWNRSRRGSRESKRNSIDSPKQLPDLKEKEIEKLILEWLNAQPGCKAWKNKSMGTFDPVKRIYRANHSRFSEKGSSDILGIWQGKMLCIEVKSRRGTLRPEQKDFLETMDSFGAITLVARSLHDVVDRLCGPHGTENTGHQSDQCEPTCRTSCNQMCDIPHTSQDDSE